MNSLKVSDQVNVGVGDYITIASPKSQEEGNKLQMTLQEETIIISHNPDGSGEVILHSLSG